MYKRGCVVSQPSLYFINSKLYYLILFKIKVLLKVKLKLFIVQTEIYIYKLCIYSEIIYIYTLKVRHNTVDN